MLAQHFRQNGISVTASEPLVRGGGYIDYLTPSIRSYSDTKTIFGGFWSANLSIEQPETRMEDWIEDGLMRHIEIKSQSGIFIFEGFVNRITIKRNGQTTAIGPLLDMANRIRLQYSAVDTSGDTAVVGLRASTDWYNDLLCQERYGVLEAVYSAGGINEQEIDATMRLQLKRACTPNQSDDVQLSNNRQSVGIDIEVMGYVHLLDKFTFNSSLTNTRPLYEKLIDVLNADPNGIIQVDRARIYPNSLPIAAYEDDDKMAMSLVKGMLSRGDADYNQYLFGIFGNREALYQPIAEEISYTRRFSESGQYVLDVGGGWIDPWEVLPGKWLQQGDLMVGSQAASLNADARSTLIHTVRFTAPNQLVINGSSSFSIDRKLAQLGLSGIGA